jgi:dUTPase
MNANFDQKYAGEVAMLNQNYDKEAVKVEKNKRFQHRYDKLV